MTKPKQQPTDSRIRRLALLTHRVAEEEFTCNARRAEHTAKARFIKLGWHDLTRTRRVPRCRKLGRLG